MTPFQPQRLLAAQLEIILSATEAGITVGAIGRTKLVLEYLANKAAIEAGRSMEQTEDIIKTIEDMMEQNDGYMRDWIKFPKSMPQPSPHEL